jgi:predicted nucleotidyltransferase
MSTNFTISSSDPILLEKAIRVAKEFVQPFMNEDTVGIVFLGAIVRGYFDHSADIDIAIFKKQATEFPLVEKFFKVEDFLVQIWVSDYESEITLAWDMAKRWAYAQGQVYYDPLGKISQLLQEKVPLKAEEKKWMMMSGLSLSEWYVNRLTQLWVERGNMISAHQMISQGLNYFYEMLFGVNNELVADMKWRYYCVEQLERLPPRFRERVQETMMLNEISVEELERRKRAFMGMWEEMRPVIEAEVQMTYEEINNLV